MPTPTLGHVLRNSGVQNSILKLLNEEDQRPNQEYVYINQSRQFNRQDMLNLRLLSRRVATSIASHAYIDAMFGKIHISPQQILSKHRQSKGGLRAVGKHCTELHIKLCKHHLEDPREALRRWTNATFPDAVFSDDQPTITQSGTKVTSIYRTLDHDGSSDWPYIFRHLPALTTVTIETGAHPGGVRRTSISDTLTAIRIAFEESKYSSVTTIRFYPADTSYICHFSWAGPAVGAASHRAARSWSNITNVELQIQHPNVGRGSPHSRQITKQLHAWLSSLSRTLTVLKYHYVTQDSGPHPFGLHTEMEKEYWSQPPLRFPNLREIWLGRVVDEAIWRLRVDECAPKLRRYLWLIQWSGSEFLEFKEKGSLETWDRIEAYNEELQDERDSEGYRDAWYMNEMRGQLALHRRN
jgi:hypothetical protein